MSTQRFGVGRDAEYAATTTDIADVRRCIARDGYWAPEHEGVGYSPAIVRCARRGYAVISICRPAGGNEHFVVEGAGNGAWHIGGLDAEAAREYLPQTGVGLAAALRQVEAEA